METNKTTVNKPQGGDETKGTERLKGVSVGRCIKSITENLERLKLEKLLDEENDKKIREILKNCALKELGL